MVYDVLHEVDSVSGLTGLDPSVSVRSLSTITALLYGPYTKYK